MVTRAPRRTTQIVSTLAAIALVLPAACGSDDDENEAETCTTGGSAGSGQGGSVSAGNGGNAGAGAVDASSDGSGGTTPDPVMESARAMIEEGRQTFRFDTFGDEAFWGDTLKLHTAISGAANGGVGAGVSPKTALGVGLKVDVEALPATLVEALTKNEVDLDDPIRETERPSSKRRRFSSSTFREKGSREMPSRPFFSASGREK